MSNRFDKINRDDDNKLTREQELDLLEKIGSKGPPKKRGVVAKKPAAPPPDDRSVFEKITAGVYNNKQPWPKHSDKSAEAYSQRKAYRDETDGLMGLFKQDLFKEFGVQNNPRREDAYDKAWSDGHASGLHEVANCFANLVDLITSTPADPNQVTLTKDEAYVVFAALCTMVEDVHSVQDQMTEDQWKIAEAVYRRLEIAIDKPVRRRRRKS